MKMPDTIDQFLFAPCGMNCMVCYVHLKEKKPCSGCLGDDQHKPERCLNCSIKRCAKDKGHAYCYECPVFPCKQVKNLEKSYLKRYQVSLLANSRIVKEKGLEYFQNEERQKWACDCSGVISLHDRICSECKKETPR
ncbi:hypothetical protein TFLX_01615 [Thermoflexales bacterium]|nr:hypothetical protein TFLX_01615 [Thermoflexales bacterium]